MSSSIEDKIRKLLAIAQCASASEAERSLALEKELFNVRVMFRGGRHVELFGSRSARQVGDYVFTFLRREFLRCVKDYEKAIRGHLINNVGELKASRWTGLSTKQRGEYFRGLSAGLYQKIMAGRKARGTETGLIRVDAELQKEFAATFGDVPEKKIRADGVNGHGFKRGQEIDLSPALAGPKVARIGS